MGFIALAEEGPPACRSGGGSSTAGRARRWPALGVILALPAVLPIGVATYVSWHRRLDSPKLLANHDIPFGARVWNVPLLPRSLGDDHEPERMGHAYYVPRETPRSPESVWLCATIAVRDLDVYVEKNTPIELVHHHLASAHDCATALTFVVGRSNPESVDRRLGSLAPILGDLGFVHAGWGRFQKTSVKPPLIVKATSARDHLVSGEQKDFDAIAYSFTRSMTFDDALAVIGAVESSYLPVQRVSAPARSIECSDCSPAPSF